MCNVINAIHFELAGTTADSLPHQGRRQGGGARGAIAPPVLSYWYEYNFTNIITIVECFNFSSAFFQCDYPLFAKA